MEFKNQYLQYREYMALDNKFSEMPFNLLEFEARKIIDNFTFGRLKNLKDQVQEVKLCVFSLINEINDYNTVKSNVSSESVGSYSVTYNKPVSIEQNKKYKNIVETYLSDCKLDNGAPYLYKG
jgi:hypothetical protein